MLYNYIAIEGNIGSGKTSLATKISEEYNAKLILEQFEDNPFLPKFYKKPEQYAFPLELSFLASRFHQLKDDLTKQDLFKSFTISDYFINKTLIFARKTLQQDEFALFSKLFNIINTTLPKPDLLVYLYLSVDNLKRNILFRGRSYEQNIEKDYLEKIQKSYLDFIKAQQNIRILIIDTNKIDFVKNDEDYRLIKESILNTEYKIGISRISL
ncbi:MAG TPA: deoxynucleoside kinase [Bacteroidales bacterium]|nr:deoxynucleoside kinase [Bacteroidales bacterium]HPS18384.1 deoxynucleoside kinase [Bacteroidales bacterium]